MTRALRARRRAGLAGLVLILIGGAGWAVARGAPGRPPRRHQVEIRGMAFRPATLRIARGDTVRWINRDPVPHTATASATQGTAVLARGDSGFLVADRRGDLRYTCTLHPTMEGRISVR